MLMPLENRHMSLTFQNVKLYLDTVCNNVTDAYNMQTTIPCNYSNDMIMPQILIQLLITLSLSICNYVKAKYITRMNLLLIPLQLLCSPSSQLAILFTHTVCQ